MKTTKNVDDLIGSAIAKDSARIPMRPAVPSAKLLASLEASKVAAATTGTVTSSVTGTATSGVILTKVALAVFATSLVGVVLYLAVLRGPATIQAPPAKAPSTAIISADSTQEQRADTTKPATVLAPKTRKDSLRTARPTPVPSFDPDVFLHPNNIGSKTSDSIRLNLHAR